MSCFLIQIKFLFSFKQNKDDEIAMLRGLVRQQEDATRLLGEKMRNEAQEHVRGENCFCQLLSVLVRAVSN